MARLPYVDPDTAPAPVRQLLERLPAQLNIFRLIAHAETNARPLLALGTSILAAQQLSPRLRELLEQYRDQPAPQNLVFAPSDTLVVPAGELIRREHLAAFNKIVQDELSLIEERFAMERDRLDLGIDRAGVEIFEFGG